VAAARAFAGQRIVYYGDGVGPAGEMEKAATDRFNQDTGVQVQFTQRPQDATEALALFQRFFQGPVVRH
jgi:trehalose/maltose transport system substrate-binding protein